MSVAKIKSALVTAITAAPAIIPEDKLFVTNRAGNSPLEGLWAMVEFNPASQVPATLGVGGEDEVKGQFTIGLSYPLNTGEGMVTAAVDLLNQRFYAGKSFTYSGQSVRVDAVSLGKSFSIPNGHRTPYIITWSARIKRQTT